MNTNLPEIPDFTTHELLSSYHDGIKEAVDFIQAQVVPTLNGQINLSKHSVYMWSIMVRTEPKKYSN